MIYRGYTVWEDGDKGWVITTPDGAEDTEPFATEEAALNEVDVIKRAQRG